MLEHDQKLIACVATWLDLARYSVHYEDQGVAVRDVYWALDAALGIWSDHARERAVRLCTAMLYLVARREEQLGITTRAA